VLAKPYTRTGDIVIAVNPYQWLTHFYTEKEQMKYANMLVWQSGDGDNRKQVEPHVYETSALCYKGLAVDNTSQSILVSGESGAGTFDVCVLFARRDRVCVQPSSPARTAFAATTSRLSNPSPRVTCDVVFMSSHSHTLLICFDSQQEKRKRSRFA
jgi:Myosin head (motor domain)